MGYYGGERESARRKAAAERAERRLPKSQRTCSRCNASMGLMTDWIYNSVNNTICERCFRAVKDI